MCGWMWLGLEVDVYVCVGEWVEQVRREVKRKKKVRKSVWASREICVSTFVCEGVCLCVSSCSETGPLHSGGVVFFFFSCTVLIPHSDHSSSARTRETNNASDMSLVEQRLSERGGGPSPPSPPTALSTHCSVHVCVYTCDCVVHWFQPAWWMFLLDYLGLIWWTLCPLWMPLDKEMELVDLCNGEKWTRFSSTYLIKLIMANLLAPIYTSSRNGVTSAFTLGCVSGQLVIASPMFKLTFNCFGQHQLLREISVLLFSCSVRHFVQQLN